MSAQAAHSSDVFSQGLLSRALEISNDFRADDLTGPQVIAVLGMVLGVYLEGEPDSNRNLEPVSQAMLVVAKSVFDTFRANRGREAGHA